MSLIDIDVNELEDREVAHILFERLWIPAKDSKQIWLDRDNNVLDPQPKEEATKPYVNYLLTREGRWLIHVNKEWYLHDEDKPVVFSFHPDFYQVFKDNLSWDDNTIENFIKNEIGKEWVFENRYERYERSFGELDDFIKVFKSDEHKEWNPLTAEEKESNEITALFWKLYEECLENKAWLAVDDAIVIPEEYTDEYWANKYEKSVYRLLNKKGRLKWMFYIHELTTTKQITFHERFFKKFDKWGWSIEKLKKLFGKQLEEIYGEKFAIFTWMDGVEKSWNKPLNKI